MTGTTIGFFSIPVAVFRHAIAWKTTLVGLHREIWMHFIKNFKNTSKWHCHFCLFKNNTFAIAYAAEILDGKSAIDTRFDVPAIKNHLILCFVERDLRPFPKVKQDDAWKFWLKVYCNFIYFYWKTFFLALSIFVTVFSKMVMFVYHILWVYSE